MSRQPTLRVSHPLGLIARSVSASAHHPAQLTANAGIPSLCVVRIPHLTCRIPVTRFESQQYLSFSTSFLSNNEKQKLVNPTKNES